MTDSESDVTPERRKMSAGSIGCGALIGLCALIAVINGLFGDDDDEPKAPTVPMVGSIIVADQRSCAGGALVKIESAGNMPVVIKFEKANAPCNLSVDVDVPIASQYEIKVEKLAPVIVKASEVRTMRGGEKLEIKLIVGGD